MRMSSESAVGSGADATADAPVDGAPSATSVPPVVDQTADAPPPTEPPPAAAVPPPAGPPIVERGPLASRRSYSGYSYES